MPVSLYIKGSQYGRIWSHLSELYVFSAFISIRVARGWEYSGEAGGTCVNNFVIEVIGQKYTLQERTAGVFVVEHIVQM